MLAYLAQLESTRGEPPGLTTEWPASGTQHVMSPGRQGVLVPRFTGWDAEAHECRGPSQATQWPWRTKRAKCIPRGLSSTELRSERAALRGASAWVSWSARTSHHHYCVWTNTVEPGPQPQRPEMSVHATYADKAPTMCHCYVRLSSISPHSNSRK